MQVSLNTYKPYFGNNTSYNKGFNHGKNDGLKGSRSYPKPSEDENIIQDDYDNGYNAGYKTGRSMRVEDKVTVTDVIQDLIAEGMPKNRAIEFASQCYGGW